jgi:hypothetical protein
VQLWESGVTYDEWAECTNPIQMLDLLDGKVSHRRVRLLSSGWIRFSFPPVAVSRIASCLDRVDSIADGLQPSEGLLQQMLDLYRDLPDLSSDTAYLTSLDYIVIGDPFFGARNLILGRSKSLQTAFCQHIRCVFGNPWPHLVRPTYPRLKEVGMSLLKIVAGHPNFRDVSSIEQPALMDSPPFADDWRTSTAVTLAQQMYDSRDFSAMPILADALQDAGCDNADILDHCRGPGPHVRGCWVVDLVLGKV